MLRLLAAAESIANRSPDGASDSGSAEIVVVTGCHHREIQSELLSAGKSSPGLIAENRDWATGRASSIQLAVRTFPNRDLVLMPVDHPRITAPILDAMIGAWREAGSPAMGWLAPFHETGPGQRAFGHPILLGRGLGPEVLDLAPGDPLRAVRAAADPLLAVQVASEAILENLDTPSALEQIQRADLP